MVCLLIKHSNRIISTHIHGVLMRASMYAEAGQGSRGVCEIFHYFITQI